MSKKVPSEQADDLYKQGRMLASQQQYEQAIEKFREAEKIVYQAHDEHFTERMGIYEWEIAAAYLNSGKPEDSIEHYDSSFKCFSTISGFIWSSGFGSKEKYNVLMGRCNQILSEKAKALFLSGMNAVNNNEARKALTFFEGAKKLQSNFGEAERGRIGETTTEIAFTYFKLDEYGKALENFKSAQSTFENIIKSSPELSSESKQKNSYFMVRIFLGIGNTLAKVGANKEALAYYSKSRKFSKEYTKNENAKFWLNYGIHIGVANVKQNMKQYDSAIKQYNLILAHLEQKGQTQLEIAEVEMNIGNTYSLMKCFDKARQYYEMAKSIFWSLKDYQRIADININIGNNFLKLSKYEEAKVTFEESKDISDSYGFIATQSLSLAGLAEAYLYLKDIASSLNYAMKSVRLMEYIRGSIKSSVLQRNLLQHYLQNIDFLAHIHLSLFQKERDINHFGTAFDLFELTKNTTFAESLQIEPITSSSEKTKELMVKEDKLVNLLQTDSVKLEQTAKLRGAGEITSEEFKNSKEIWEKEYAETLKEVENLRLELLISDEDSGSRPIPRNYNILSRAIETLPKDEKWCILEYAFSTSSNQWIVFQINQDRSVDYGVLTSTNEKIQDIARRCRNITTAVHGDWKKQADTALNEISKDLYQMLIPKKIGDSIKNANIDYLIIIPDSILHWIPFEILNDGNDFWGLKYALSYNFSLDIGSICINKFNKHGLSLSNSSNFLLVQNPTCDLEGADDEGNLIMNLMKSRGIEIKPLIREQAKEKDFLDSANSFEYSVYHHAGHAEFLGQDPSLSYLRFHANENCSAKDCGGTEKSHSCETLNANEVTQKLRFRSTPLVYLSACETGISEIETGNEAFGLLRALMYAGATSLVSSKWKVSDKIGPVFAEVFYTQMLNGDLAAIALRKARKAAFEKNPEAVSDWAVFSLNGNPFQKIV